MIKQLSQVLQKLLQDNGLIVVFNRPTPEYAPENSCVSLFLYDIRENVTLRNNESIVERQNGQAITYPPPMRVDCSYLVTAWPRDGKTEEGLLLEHQLLSQVLQIFARYPTIPASALSGLPNDSPLRQQEYPIPLVTAHAETLRNLGEFWSAMGGQLRASITVAATLSVSTRTAVLAPMVTTLIGDFDGGTEAGQETWLQIGGRVLDAAGQGVSAALVDLLDMGLKTHSDENGYFVFSPVSAGSHAIRVVAVGYEPKTQSFVVPGRSEDYEIHLTTLVPIPGS